MKENKIYINNSDFMEYIDELATQITEMNYGNETYTEGSYEGNQEGVMIFNEDAQDFYNEMYDEYEGLTNSMLGVYPESEKEDDEDVPEIPGFEGTLDQLDSLSIRPDKDFAKGGETATDYSGEYRDLRTFVMRNGLREAMGKKYGFEAKDYEDYVRGELGYDTEVIKELAGDNYKVEYIERYDEETGRRDKDGEGVIIVSKSYAKGGKIEEAKRKLNEAKKSKISSAIDEASRELDRVSEQEGYYAKGGSIMDNEYLVEFKVGGEDWGTNVEARNYNEARKKAIAIFRENNPNYSRSDITDITAKKGRYAKGGSIDEKRERVIDYFINNEGDEELISRMGGIGDERHLEELLEDRSKNDDEIYERISDNYDDRDIDELFNEYLGYAKGGKIEEVDDITNNIMDGIRDIFDRIDLLDYINNNTDEDMEDLDDELYTIVHNEIRKKYGIGGTLAGALVGGYVGYKIGRARPQKKGFDTEKRIYEKAKSAYKRRAPRPKTRGRKKPDIQDVPFKEVKERKRNYHFKYVIYDENKNETASGKISAPGKGKTEAYDMAMNNLKKQLREGEIIELTQINQKDFAKGGKIVWVGDMPLDIDGREELTQEEAERLAKEWKEKGYDDVIIEDYAKGGEIKMYDKIDYVDNVSKQKVKAEVIGIDEDGYTIKYKLKTPKGDMKMFKKKVKYAKGGIFTWEDRFFGSYSVYALVDGFDEAKQDYDQVYYKTDDYDEIIYYIADLKNEGEYTTDMQLIEVMPNGKMRKFNSSMLAKGGDVGDEYWVPGEILVEGNPYKNEDFFIYRDGKEVASWNVDEMEEDEGVEVLAKEMYDLYKKDKKELGKRLDRISYAKGGDIPAKIKLYQNKKGNHTVVVGGSVFEMGNNLVGKYIGELADFPSDVSHWGKVIDLKKVGKSMQASIKNLQNI